MDASEFTAIYEREYGYVERTLLRLGVSDADVADLTHDAFVVVYRRWEQKAPPPRAWLFAIALRLSANYRGRAGRTRELPSQAGDDGRVGAAGMPADEQLAEARARARLLRAMEALDLEHRAVLVLHDIEGVAAPDVASALDVPLNTIYSRLRAARQKVVAAVRRELGDEP